MTGTLPRSDRSRNRGGPLPLSMDLSMMDSVGDGGSMRHDDEEGEKRV
jgi:hypothetical protein